MILILAESTDVTTYHVSKWLDHFQEPYFIWTDLQHTTVRSITADDTILDIDGRILTFSEISAYWYRRGSINLSLDPRNEWPDAIRTDIRQEENSLLALLHERLAQLPHLALARNADINRSVGLIKAREQGLKIPEFGIFGNKEDLFSFQKRFTRIINKPLWNGLAFFDGAVGYSSHTAVFTEADRAELPETFFPSLFMEYVEKKYELRIFYLDGACYTMAILSQNDPQTMIDSRNYNKERPNRNVPYDLPEAIVEKLTALMKELRLKTGSIDMIVMPEDEFVFLEVNPVGQFLNVSHTCNYNLEKRVAEYLVTLSRQYLLTRAQLQLEVN